jgi:acetoin utilization deacetylase AcuC-like enzyme
MSKHVVVSISFHHPPILPAKEVPRATTTATTAATTATTAITRRQPRRAVALYTDFDCFFHQTPSSHPETSQRVMKLWERLYQSFDTRVDWCTNSPRVSINLLFNVHSPQYISRFLSACKHVPNNNVPKNFMLCCQGASHKKGRPSVARSRSNSGSGSNGSSGSSSGGGGGGGSGAPKRTTPVPSANDHDTFFSTNAGGGSVSAGLKAPGSVVAAVEAVLGGLQSHAFCLIRPPGHHCGYDGVPRKGLGEASDVGQGFCLINNVAVAMCHALKQYNVKVAIIDIDLHHGNGTQEIVERMYMNNIAGLSEARHEQRLFFSSLHSESIFPWTSPDRMLPSGVPTNMIHNVHVSCCNVVLSSPIVRTCGV